MAIKKQVYTRLKSKRKVVNPQILEVINAHKADILKWQKQGHSLTSIARTLNDGYHDSFEEVDTFIARKKINEMRKPTITKKHVEIVTKPATKNLKTNRTNVIEKVIKPKIEIPSRDKITLKEWIRDLSEDQKLDLLLNNPLLKEEFEIFNFGGELLEAKFGPDGVYTIYDEKRFLEIKTKKQREKSKLNLSIVYSDPSFNIYNKKIENNGETIINCFYNKTGEKILSYKVEFLDIKNEYQERIKDTAKNLSIPFRSIKDAASFEILVLDKTLVLEKDFSIKDYNYLMSI